MSARNRPKARKVSAAAPSIADLQKQQVGTLTRELKETNERQWAIAEVLQVINLSQGNLAPVFDAILEKAWGLCGAAFVNLWTYDDERQHATALRGVPQAHAEFLTRAPLPVGPLNAHVRLLRVSYDFDLDTAGVIIALAAERRLPKLREAHHLVNAQLL